MTLTPVAAGTATVTVTARDPGGLSATQSIAVTVQAAGGVNGFTDDLSDWRGRRRHQGRVGEPIPRRAWEDDVLPLEPDRDGLPVPR